MPAATTTWAETARTHLKGRTIIEVFYLPDDEVEDLGWDASGLVLLLDNQTQVLVQQDDEGNGPGALLVISDAGGLTLPTI